MLGKSQKKTIIHQFLQSPTLPLDILSERISDMINIQKGAILEFLFNVTESKPFGRVLKKDILQEIETSNDNKPKKNHENHSNKNKLQGSYLEFKKQNAMADKIRKVGYQHLNVPDIKKIKKDGHQEKDNPTNAEKFDYQGEFKKLNTPKPKGRTKKKETQNILRPSEKTDKVAMNNRSLELLCPPEKKRIPTTENEVTNKPNSAAQEEKPANFANIRPINSNTINDYKRIQISRSQRILNILSECDLFEVNFIPSEILRDFLIIYNFIYKYRTELKIENLIAHSSEKNEDLDPKTEVKTSDSKNSENQSDSLNKTSKKNESEESEKLNDSVQKNVSHMSIQRFIELLDSNYIQLIISVFNFIQQERRREKVAVFNENFTRAIELYWDDLCDPKDDKNDEVDLKENLLEKNENNFEKTNNTFLENIQRVNWFNTKSSIPSILSFMLDIKRQLHIISPKNIDLRIIQKKNRTILENDENEIKSKILLLKFFIDIIYEGNLIKNITREWNKELENDLNIVKEYAKEIRTEIKRLKMLKLNAPLQTHFKVNKEKPLEKPPVEEENKNFSLKDGLSSFKKKVSEAHLSVNEDAKNSNGKEKNEDKKVSYYNVEKMESQSLIEKTDIKRLGLPTLPIFSEESPDDSAIIKILEKNLNDLVRKQNDILVLIKKNSLSAQVFEFNNIIFLYIDGNVLYYKNTAHQFFKVSKEKVRNIVGIGGDVGDSLRYCQ